ncbi:MAG: hypothetical protein Q7N50_16300, partial [Armatimonadota bacterium]|nr:hypothetical protein [Armatimonadota bacterium]
EDEIGAMIRLFEKAVKSIDSSQIHSAYLLDRNDGHIEITLVTKADDAELIEKLKDAAKDVEAESGKSLDLQFRPACDTSLEYVSGRTKFAWEYLSYDLPEEDVAFGLDVS